MNMQQYLSNPRIFFTGPVFGVGVVSLPLHPPPRAQTLQGPWGGVAGAMVCSVNAEMTDLCYFMIAITEMELLLSIMAP